MQELVTTAKGRDITVKGMEEPCALEDEEKGGEMKNASCQKIRTREYINKNDAAPPEC